MAGFLVRHCASAIFVLLAAFVGLGQTLYEGIWPGSPMVAGVYGNQMVIGTVHALYAGLLLERAWDARGIPSINQDFVGMGGYQVAPAAYSCVLADAGNSVDAALWFG